MKESDSSEPGVKVRLYTYSLKANRVSDKPSKVRQSATSIALRNAAHPDATLARFNVRLQEWHPVRLVPETLFIEHVDGAKQGIERQIRVSVSDTRFKLTSVDASGSVSWIHAKSVRLINNGDTSEALFTVDIRPDDMPNDQTIRANLLVKAYGDHADSVNVTMPVIVKKKSPE
jgi:hypothetical protein